MYFILNNFALTRKSDVQTLWNIIGSKFATLRYLCLENIECPVDECNKQDSDGPDGFLDPLFHSPFGVDDFSVSTKMRSVHSSLVSPRVLRALFVEGERFRSLSLRSLGLTDNHVLAIVDGLSTRGTHLRTLNLESNPGITARGYGALLNLINQTEVIGYVKRCRFCVDNKVWQGKLNLVSDMNSKYRRLEYLTNGTFTSEKRKWQWLERVVNLRIEKNKEWDPKHLNFIWYTLRQNPEMMQVSQAPTRTNKRKAT
jgi:hypothetical protein